MGVTPFCSDRPCLELEAIDRRKARLQLLPDALVGPLVDVLVRLALKIEPADRGRAHAEQREAAVVIRVDELFRCRRHFGEDAEPRKGIHTLEYRSTLGGMLGRQMPWKPSQPAMKSHSSTCSVPFEPEAHAGRSPSMPCNGDVLHLEMQRPAGRDARGHQILHHFLLAVDGHDMAGELAEVDAMARAR